MLGRPHGAGAKQQMHVGALGTLVDASGLLQLTVLAATTVVGAVIDVLAVGLGLTGKAAANAGDGLPPGFRDLLAALLAMVEALARGQRAPGAGDGIVDARVDLVLHGSVMGPAAGHGL